MRALALLLLTSNAFATKYTLEQLISKVKSEYPGVVSASENIASAEAQMSQARRLWWPTGQMTFGFTLAPSVHCQRPIFNNDGSPELDSMGHQVNVRDTTNCINTDVNTADATNSHALNLTNPALRFNIDLVQPIYTSGKIEAAIKAASAGRDAAKIQLEAARADVVLNVVKAYWGVKAARAAGATLSDGRDRLKEWVDKIDQALSGSGKTTYTEQDLLRLKIGLETIELGLLDVQKGEKVAMAALRTLTVDENADVDDMELDVVEMVERPLSYYEDAARTHRPEAKLLDVGRTAIHAMRNLSLSQMLPDIGLVGSLSYSYVQGVDDPQNAFMNHPNSFGVGLYLAVRQTLEIPEKLAGFSKARADERAFEAKRKEALGGIALEIEKAYADADAARKRQALTAHGEKIARGWYNSVDQLLQVGTVESKDLVDAARSYFEMRLQHLSAIMDMNVSLASLKRAAGVE